MSALAIEDPTYGAALTDAERLEVREWAKATFSYPAPWFDVEDAEPEPINPQREAVCSNCHLVYPKQVGECTNLCNPPEGDCE